MNRFQEALDVQDACNPSGVAHLFVSMCREFVKSADYAGTMSLRSDPALRLVAHKLAHLMSVADIGAADYGRAFAACQQRAKLTEGV